jgi:hypothetical protein
MPAAAIIPAAIGVAGAVGAGIAASKKVGMNQTATKNFGQSGQYDPNAFQYGGAPGVAQQDVSRFQQAAGASAGRAATQADYGMANAYANNANTMRGAQLDAAGLMMARANGSVPSIAGQQAEIDTRRAMAAQASQAASARGAAGLALAGQQAASNTANVQSQIANQAQVNAANERMAAEQAAFGAYGNVRGGDMSAQQQEAQQQQFQSGLAMQQQQMNDAREQAFLEREQAVRQMQMQGQMQGQGLLAGSYDAQQGLNQQRLQHNADKGLQWFQAGMGAATGGAQAAMSGMGGKK